MTQRPMLTFWAKSGQQGDAAPMHSVAHHSLDVAACTLLLAPMLRQPVPIAAETIAFLVALHDIGKFTRPFQAKASELWPLALGPFRLAPGCPHDQAGFVLLRTALTDALDPLFADADARADAVPLLRAVAGHHGRPPAMERLLALDRRIACPVCLAAARDFTSTAYAVIAPPPLPTLSEPQITRLAWWLAGLATLADWIGSSRRWFPPVDAMAEPDLAEYWRAAQAKARRAIADAGLGGSTVAPAGKMATLFPEITKLNKPTPLQRWAEGVVLPDGPALFVIEDATGAGKTEAALVLAHRLLAAGRGGGLF